MKTFTRDETEHGVKYYLASEVDALLAGIGAQPATEIQAKYSLDDDPMGIRARVVHTVLGALTLGAQGTNKPPEGHWLGPVWDLARAQEPADKPKSVNVLIDGAKYEVPMAVAGEMLRLTLLLKQPSQDYAAKNPLGGPAKVFDAMAAAIRAGDSYESVLGAYGFAEVGAAPMFWYRPVGEDGGYEGPIHNSQIEKFRSMGGTWVPLFAGTALTALQPVQPAQPVQEIVGWFTQARCFVPLHECTEADAKLYGWKALYTTPPAAQPPLPVQPAQETAKPKMWEDQIKAAHPKSEPEFWPDDLRLKYMAAELNEYRASAPLPVQKPVATCERCADEIVESNAGLCANCLPAVFTEPVAWMHEWADGERIPLMYASDSRDKDKPVSVRPLVFGDTTTPAAQTAQPAVPSKKPIAPWYESARVSDYNKGWNKCIDAMMAAPGQPLSNPKQLEPRQLPTNCRHCGGPDNVIFGGQCRRAANPLADTGKPMGGEA